MSTVSIVLLAFASTLGPFATNGIVPSFITLSTVFGVSLAAMQSSLTIYLAAFALGSLVVGAISDTFGRCRVLALGMCVFCLATLFAMRATSLAEFNTWRLVQGLGASVGQVITQAMVRDRFSGMVATRVMSMIGMIFAVSPALAPVIGGWCVVTYEWRAVFWFLFAYAAVIVLIATLALDETLPKNKRKPFHLGELARSYASCLKNKAFFFGVASNSMAMMGTLLVIAGGADFVVRVMGFEVDEFAWMSFPVVTAALIGTSIAPTHAEYCGTRAGIVRAFGLAAVVELALAAYLYFEPPRYVMIIAIPIAFQFVSATVRPPMMVMNLDYNPARRGMAASIQQCFITGGFALASSIMVPLCMGEAYKYALGTAVAAVLSGLFWAISIHYRSSCLPRERDGEIM